MIAFISIFFGLVTGVTPVELAVSGDVREVELRLDGELVGVLRGAPWKLDCDFGRDLTTHVLVAVARGPFGTEIGRASQLINIPRPHVDTQLMLDGWRAGRPRSARLIWRSVEPVEPSAVSIILDGRVLADRFAERYELPELDPEVIHFLSARLECPGNLSASAEVVFGGVYGSSTDTQLTAVPVTGRKLRRLEQVQGLLEKDGQPLRVVALEDGPAEAVIVRDRRALARLAALEALYTPKRDEYPPASLARDDALLVMSPRAYLAVHPEHKYAVFPLSAPTTRKDASLPWMLAAARFDHSPVLPQQLTSAVATAGLRAAASQKRRAVVLVTSDCADVSGQWSPQAVRRYLAQLRVPLRVWQVERPAADAHRSGGFCDGVQLVENVIQYTGAIRRLRRDLQGQQIVWVEGRHLQRKITLTGGDPRMRLAD